MTIRFYLDKPNATCKTAIYLFIRAKKKTYKFNTGRSITPKFWDCKKQEVKSGHPSKAKLNQFLTNLKTDVFNAKEELVQKGATTLEEIKNTVAAIVAGKDLQETKVGFLEAYQLFLNAYKVSRSEATVKKYKTILSHLNKYSEQSNSDLSFNMMDIDFQERFVAYLIQTPKLTNNTIARHIKFLKTFLVWATERGYNSKADFKKFRQKEEKVDIITLTYEELITLHKLDLSTKPKLERVRDVFCFGCFTGQRFSDIAALQPEHIKENKWHLHSQKTKDIITVPLNEFALEILIKYTIHGQKLPSVSNQKTNKYLKELGELVGINEPITHVRYQGVKKIQCTLPKYKFIGTHTARRTFCTLSLEKGMQPEIAMKISGHKDYRTFQKYINLTSKVVDTSMQTVWCRN
ncbi:site-specific integrase [Pontibacter vulgaris]|uniref:site-specific integrase n=1 Tax=Pontibacter vulgaris TaxID=2905679 RepID=UPI001FA7F55B|nr:site-specific integrase [Pontibacter vulgaris]